MQQREPITLASIEFPGAASSTPPRLSSAVESRLNADDDPAFWEAATKHILAEAQPHPGMLIEIGRCSHWLRPHQNRWTADGGFAEPTGYGSGQGGYDFLALPQFDWSVVLEWDGQEWTTASSKAAHRSLRLTLPSRTRRHAQAAVHSVWLNEGEKETWFYGFRRRSGAWTCTASSLISPRRKR